MIFLIEYDRARASLVNLTRFDDADREKAWDARLALELARHRAGRLREIVLLEATDEAAIRRTHRRYFERLEDLARIPKAIAE